MNGRPPNKCPKCGGWKPRHEHKCVRCTERDADFQALDRYLASGGTEPRWTLDQFDDWFRRTFKKEVPK